MWLDQSYMILNCWHMEISWLTRRNYDLFSPIGNNLEIHTNCRCGLSQNKGHSPKWSLFSLWSILSYLSTLWLKAYSNISWQSLVCRALLKLSWGKLTVDSDELYKSIIWLRVWSSFLLDCRGWKASLNSNQKIIWSLASRLLIAHVLIIALISLPPNALYWRLLKHSVCNHRIIFCQPIQCFGVVSSFLLL